LKYPKTCGRDGGFKCLGTTNFQLRDIVVFDERISSPASPGNCHQVFVIFVTSQTLAKQARQVSTDEFPDTERDLEDIFIV